jgi:hypothetical protein
MQNEQNTKLARILAESFFEALFTLQESFPVDNPVHAKRSARLADALLFQNPVRGFPLSGVLRREHLRRIPFGFRLPYPALRFACTGLSSGNIFDVVRLHGFPSLFSPAQRTDTVKVSVNQQFKQTVGRIARTTLN